MPATVDTRQPIATVSSLDRALALFTEVRAGEGVTALLMMANVFVLLVCYSVIKTVREPLILLGGGAEVRSYAAAGQAILLMGFVPLYSLVASKVDRMKLVVGVTLFFVACIELFAALVAARVPFVGVAFFIWVGIFNISLVAQFWSFANDIYRKEAGDRLFPMIMIGMTAGAPLGSLVAARLFRAGLAPQTILQLSAFLLAASVSIYVLVNRRVTRNAAAAEPLVSSGGFSLVLGNRYLRLVAALVVLLNIVNTTGEYVVARLLSAHVADLAAMTPGFDKRAFIGAFSGEYQFWVNVTAFVLQAFVASRLVRYKGLQGALLALPLIALGGYSLIAAGAGFAVVRWVKTAENATDYSIMNTARQMLWLPTNREEKYKAKQAVDTFFVRIGDVLSAAVVFAGTKIMHLGPSEFARVNVVLALAWIGVAMFILRPSRTARVVRMPRLANCGAAAVIAMLVLPAVAAAQETRAEALADRQAEKAANLKPYTLNPIEQKIDFIERRFLTPHTFYPFIGGVLEGGGLAVGPGYRRPFGDSGLFAAHAAWSIRNYGIATASVALPELRNGRVRIEMHGERLHAPGVAFFGGQSSVRADKQTFGLDQTTVGASVRVQPGKLFAAGGGFDLLQTSASGNPAADKTALPSLDPTYGRSTVFAEVDTRTSPAYSKSGGLYRASFADYRQSNGSESTYQRVDTEVQRFIPIVNDSRVVALRASAATTVTSGGQTVPYFMLPELGGHHALRGYSSWRFRDRSRLLLSGEYRWTAGPLVDMSLFVDAGQVAPRLSELTMRDFRTSYGLGFTVHTPSTTITRFEVARSREGIGLLVSFGPSF
jgi:AAA family ATP:ADP antiporter